MDQHATHLGQPPFAASHPGYAILCRDPMMAGWPIIPSIRLDRPELIRAHADVEIGGWRYRLHILGVEAWEALPGAGRPVIHAPAVGADLIIGIAPLDP